MIFFLNSKFFFGSNDYIVTNWHKKGVDLYLLLHYLILVVYTLNMNRIE
jgi:hypothetical protein